MTVDKGVAITAISFDSDLPFLLKVAPGETLRMIAKALRVPDDVVRNLRKNEWHLYGSHPFDALVSIVNMARGIS